MYFSSEVFKEGKFRLNIRDTDVFWFGEMYHVIDHFRSRRKSVPHSIGAAQYGIEIDGGEEICKDRASC